jgi:hypothetical protein
VAMGYSQRPGLDHRETYAEVPRMESLMVFLAKVATEDLELLQADVKTAFLNGDLEEELYMTQPPGFVVGPETLVCKIKKSLYGLKQAPRAWREKRNEIMEKLGFKPALADTCIYIKKTRYGKILVFFYVDDVLVAARILHMVEQALWDTAKLVDTRLMGEPVRVLGREIKQNRAEKLLLVTQKVFTEELLNRFGMAEANARETQMDANLKIRKAADGKVVGPSEAKRYSEIIGALLYLATGTRPDIATPVGMLARFMGAPGKEHLDCVKEVLRGLRGT